MTEDGQETSCPQMLVVAAAGEVPAAQRVWGTGGWLPAEARPAGASEALDWLTLARLSGWAASVSHVSRNGSAEFAHGASRWVVVARAGIEGGAFARLCGVSLVEGTVGGKNLRWAGPGVRRGWACRGEFEASALKLSGGAEAWATLDGAPVVAAKSVGCGVVATLAFHPSAARDTEGAFTALLKHLLIYGACAPVAWLDTDGVLVLRMDDPGGAQNVHCRGWYYTKLSEAAWRVVGAELGKRGARLSVCYTLGWVDDGDARRGRLSVGGESLGAAVGAESSGAGRREAGRVYPSPRVVYEDVRGHAPGTLHDYAAEYRGIERLRGAGLAEVELHGHTHLHPDAAAWAAAPDRYESFAWYRELGQGAADAIAARTTEEHPLALGVSALREFFGVRPTTLICPGDEWTEDVIERALDLRFFFVSDHHLAVRAGGRFCWTSHVASPYLSEPHASRFDAGLPVVGYFHDRDLALEGVPWMSFRLDAWADAGARKFWDFRELAAAVGREFRLEGEAGGGYVLTVNVDICAPALVRPLAVNFYVPGGEAPARVEVRHEGRARATDVDPCGVGVGRVILGVEKTQAALVL